MTTSVTIRIVRHFASVPARHADRVRPALERYGYALSCGGPTGLQHQPIIEPFYGTDEKGRLLTTAGLVPRIQRHLKAADVRTRLVDRTRWRFLEARNLELYDAPGITALDRQCLDAVGTSPRGVLVVRSHELPRHVSLICDLFPTARIIMVTATSQQKIAMRAKLEEFMGVTVETDDVKMWPMERKLYLATASIFSCANRFDWDVVIFLDPESVVAKRPRYNVRGMLERGQLLYAFQSPHHVLEERDQLWLETICGPVIFRSPDPRGDLAAVQVEWVESPALALPGHGTAWERKQALWHHPQRNAGIADIARAVRAKERKLLRAAGLTDMARKNREWWSAWVLVESREQAEVVASLLPDWPVMDRQSTSDHVDYGIVTLGYASQRGVVCDVLIRADGGPGWPLQGQFPRRHGAPQRAWLVDFEDTGDEATNQITASRREAYERKGWALPASPSPARALSTAY